MKKTAVACLVTWAVMLGLTLASLPASADPGAQVAPEIAQAAVGYADAVAGGDFTKAWSLLSRESRAGITAAQWEAAFRQPPPSSKAIASGLLRALATAETPAEVADVFVQPNQALIQVTGSTQITCELVLVKEPAGWRVDLAASDRLNGIGAGQLFLELLQESSPPTSTTGPAPVTARASMALARSVLASEVKHYQVLHAEVQGDRAQVTVGAELPVSVILRANRVGPGWRVDMTNPIMEGSPTSPHPLAEAAGAASKGECMQQLQRLAGAFRMYLSSSDDTLPDPDRWLDQLRPLLPEGFTAHCPEDQQAGVSYAFNRNLAGMRRSAIANPANVPLLFESTLHTANPADTGKTWADPPRHPDGNHVLFADGSVRAVSQKPSFSVTRVEVAAPPRAPRVTAPPPTLAPAPQRLPQAR